jgi:hypothetical protein
MRKEVRISGEAARKRGCSMPPKGVLNSKEKREYYGIKLVRNINN